MALWLIVHAFVTDVQCHAMRFAMPLQCHATSFDEMIIGANTYVFNNSSVNSVLGITNLLFYVTLC